MKTIDLRNLSDSERDAAINEAVMVMEGWVKRETRQPPFWMDGDKNPAVVWVSRNGSIVSDSPPYATSCDAVMPLLERCSIWRFFGKSEGTMTIWPQSTGMCYTAQAATFPIAACIALLRANGVEVLT